MTAPHDPGCQCHAVPCRTARGLIVDGVDLVPMPAPPPPATDPQGWVPLVRGGKLPEKDSYPLVTLLDETLGQRRTLSAHYLPNSFAVGSRVYLGPDFDTFVYAAGHNGTHKGLRLLAWRPAPAPPYRGAR